ESLGKEHIKGRRFLLPRAAAAREILPQTLRQLGAEIDVVHAYQTLLPQTKNDDFLATLRREEIDAVTFTSSSTVKNFIKLIGEENRPQLAKTAIACIGPITAKTAEDCGLNVDVIPDRYTVEALADAVEAHFAKP
ncbi:MAG: uroporphyrinogen-III synthase, partial [Nitrospinales bacterium]